ncbi:MAG: tyrosine-type recombinase/integrase, partial [Deltaproteobacteria bacterium]|nr:tyrosine-type recombinase/integrase [Deltaproteobacteria bacterium]
VHLEVKGKQYLARTELVGQAYQGFRAAGVAVPPQVVELASQGTPLHVIQKLLGHRTIRMTERYSHLLPSAEKEAIKGLEDMVLTQKAERRTK